MPGLYEFHILKQPNLLNNPCQWRLLSNKENQAVRPDFLCLNGEKEKDDEKKVAVPMFFKLHLNKTITQVDYLNMTPTLSNRNQFFLYILISSV